MLQFVIALLLLTFQPLISADQIEYKVKAAYLYQFTKFTEWPGKEFLNINTPIRICVLGINPFGQLLDNLNSKTSQDRHLEIEYLSSTNNLSQCHVIFISQSEEHNLKQILTLTKNSPVLTVSDMNDFAERGGIIGLVIAQGNIRLEINYDASSTAGVKLSSKLLEIATLIKDSRKEN
ncbi:MAG: YfiR family protein [Thiohalomonadales bacterium]